MRIYIYCGFVLSKRHGTTKQTKSSECVRWRRYC